MAIDNSVQSDKLDKVDISLIILIALCNLGLILFGIFTLFTNSFDSFKESILSNNKIYSIIFHVFIAGLIGGSSYSLRALYQNIGYSVTPINQKYYRPLNIKVWCLWYFYRPLQGAVLSAIMICLFQHGFISLATNVESTESLYFQVGIGFLIGFGAHEVMGKIEEIIKVIFAKSNKKPTENSQDKVANNSTN